MKLRILVYVADMAASIKFYRDQVGLNLEFPVGDFDAKSTWWAEFPIGEARLCLHAGREQPIGKEAPAISIDVDDVDAWRERANARGANFGEIVEPFPGIRHCYTRDPDGVLVFLNQPHG